MNRIDVAIVQEPYSRNGVLAGIEEGDTRVVKSSTNNISGI